MYFKVKLWEEAGETFRLPHVFPVSAANREEALDKALTYCLGFRGAGEAQIDRKDERVRFPEIDLTLRIESIEMTNPEAFFRDVLYEAEPDRTLVGG